MYGPSVAASVYVPTSDRKRLLNVAIPLTAVAVTVPPAIVPAGLAIVIVTTDVAFNDIAV